MMHDGHGRGIRYLRLSLTQACGMRCVYCRPAVECRAPTDTALTASELHNLVRHLVSMHGLRKVRLTGGEPTARADIVEIVSRLAGIDGLHELTLTTNGLSLERLAAPLARAGLSRVNVSLDSLDARRFARITGVDGLSRVLAGIAAAVRSGLSPVKLNAVVIRGENDDELPDLVRFAAEQNLEIRFIELMPMGPLAAQWSRRYVSEAEMRDRLDSAVREWIELPRDAGSARTVRVVLADGRSARVGFITAMSCPFCDRCDRIRIGSDGTFYPCLMDRPGGRLLDALRPVFNARRLDDILSAGLSAKAGEHPMVGFGVMTHIGG